MDTTAVEQIIFNLVDNASKYASGEGSGKVIELRAIAHPKKANCSTSTSTPCATRGSSHWIGKANETTDTHGLTQMII